MTIPCRQKQHTDDVTKLLIMSLNSQHKKNPETLLTISTIQCESSSNTFTELHAC